MLQVFRFIFNYVVEFISMLFTIDVGFTNLGTLMCIIYILLPVMLIIVNFVKVQLVEELDDYYDYRSKRKIGYIGKHQFVGRHSKEYFRRQKIIESWNKE